MCACVCFFSLVYFLNFFFEILLHFDCQACVWFTSFHNSTSYIVLRIRFLTSIVILHTSPIIASLVRCKSRAQILFRFGGFFFPSLFHSLSLISSLILRMRKFQIFLLILFRSLCCFSSTVISTKWTKKKNYSGTVFGHRGSCFSIASNKKKRMAKKKIHERNEIRK